MKSKSRKPIGRILPECPRHQNNTIEPPYETMEKTATLCKCPKCSTTHRSYLHWTGRGTPRIYCRKCRPWIGFIDNGAPDTDTGWATSRSIRKAAHMALE